MGGAAAIGAVARGAGVAAVIADSAYASFVDAARYSFSRLTRLPAYPLLPLALAWTRRLVQIDPETLRPVDIVGRIAPRPLLIVHGGDDAIVPPAHAQHLYDAARYPRELWLVPGAGHAHAYTVDPEAYCARVDRFLRAAFAGAATGHAGGLALVAA